MNRKVLLLVGLCLALLITGAGTIMAESANLIINGDFEKQLDGWTVDFWQAGTDINVTDTKARSGKYALKIANPTTNDSRLTQVVTVKPETYYRFEGWVMVENIPENDKVGANICLMGGYDYTEAPKGTTSSWARLEFNFRTHKSQNNVTLGARLGMYCKDNTGTAYFDDLQLAELTEAPASFTQLTEPASSSGSGSASGGGGFGGILIWILGALLVAVIVVNIIFVRKKKKTASAEDDTESAASEEEEVEE